MQVLYLVPRRERRPVEPDQRLPDHRLALQDLGLRLQVGLTRVCGESGIELAQV